MLNIGWVDFSKRDRDMVLNVLRLLTEPGAVDELGIGTIRDAFSDILFPGTSTIQTRAKYLFLLPYICLELERRPKLTPSNFLKMLYDEEIKLINPLVERSGKGVGVVGEDAGERLQRKPSSIYWNALRTYGIFTEKATLSNYAEIICSQRRTAEQQKISGKRSSEIEGDTVDDTDTGMLGTSFWRVPEYKATWRDTVTIDLTTEEATFLRTQITSMPRTKDSLLAMILRMNRQDFPEFKDFSEITLLTGLMPPEMRRDYLLARDFSRFVHGAQLRYNVIYSRGENKVANDSWEQYIEERPQVDLSEVFARVKPRPRVVIFLKQYHAALDDMEKLDELIIRREQELKGKSRTKLIQPDRYEEMKNAVNMEPLSYRLRIAQTITRDVFKGVGSHA